MKKLIQIVIVFLISSGGAFAQIKAGKVDTTSHTSFYSCPKHPEVKNHVPGKCSKCGMDLDLSSKQQMKASQVKNYVCPVHLTVAAHHPGNCPKCGKKLTLSPKEQMKAEVTKAYTCAMHPEVSLNKDGNCSKCGKALIEKNKR